MPIKTTMIYLLTPVVNTMATIRKKKKNFQLPHFHVIWPLNQGYSFIFLFSLSFSLDSLNGEFWGIEMEP